MQIYMQAGNLGICLGRGSGHQNVKLKIHYQFHVNQPRLSTGSQQVVWAYRPQLSFGRGLAARPWHEATVS